MRRRRLPPAARCLSPVILDKEHYHSSAIGRSIAIRAERVPPGAGGFQRRGGAAALLADELPQPGTSATWRLRNSATGCSTPRVICLSPKSTARSGTDLSPPRPPWMMRGQHGRRSRQPRTPGLTLSAQRHCSRMAHATTSLSTTASDHCCCGTSTTTGITPVRTRRFASSWVTRICPISSATSTTKHRTELDDRVLGD
jgi:hypothetical protein